MTGRSLCFANHARAQEFHELLEDCIEQGLPVAEIKIKRTLRYAGPGADVLDLQIGQSSGFEQLAGA